MNQINNQEMIHRLSFGDKEIILVGTAHVSKESVTLVQSVIEQEKPDTVCVELCDARYQAIRQSERWLNTDIVKVIKEKKAFLLLSNLLLSSFQKRIARKLDVNPGQEMVVAIETAQAVGAGIHLADREIRVTLSRTWRHMSLMDKIKLMFQMLLSMGSVEDISESDIEKMKQEDVLEAILAEVGKEMPALRTILIDERDQYLAEKIRTAPGKKIVAVVGAGHVPGIKRNWDAQIDLAQLMALPKPRKLFRVLKWIIPLVVLALFVTGFTMGGSKAGTQMLWWWILANGVLAGLGAAVALAHPLTILSSVLAAPLTSLNPMIAAGWVSGMVEAISRKPRVKDLESLSDDIMSVRGFWRNKVTRILLVVVFTNLGSSIGTFVALPIIVKMI
ncbi:MAG: TraB/GumN family protein [Deltaproteobacteria bacterium]|nr:TraB/GumN family protein [Deltaproteobacteria bacterium]